MPQLSLYEKIESLQWLKPHISFPKAKEAIVEAQEIMEDAKKYGSET